MDIKQSNNSQTVNWEHLPEKNVLLQYLTRNDIIELSMCCKRYRKQFENQIFNVLSLTSWLHTNKDIRDKLKHSEVYDKLILILKQNMGDKLKLVNKFIFKDVFCFGVAAEVFYLLHNVNSIEFSSPYCGCCGHTSLSFINGRQNLEYITFQIYYESFNRFDKEGVIFSKSLKSLKINEEYSHYDDIPYFNSIDSSYTNLITLYIPTNEMLTNLTSTMPNLKNVGILYNREIDESLVLKFIKKNPQLKKLEFYHWPSDKLIQEVLSLKFLSYLSIYTTAYCPLDNNIYPVNFSIKKLVLGEEVYGSKVIKLINACKMLVNLDLIYWCSEKLEEIEWNKLDQSIKAIYLCYYSVCSEKNCIQVLDTLKFFDKAIITVLDEEDQDIKEFKEFNFTNLKNYKLSSMNDNSNSVTIIKTIK
ncbi:hypothetical protein CONCODRAFT_7748 [Conidiobolus coronatus NRRL 28638]|uniref:F-box domain-containing protein n=1 Tax=Conidiobolus coronatus (strain ATCC 28846 / CBS 209.66 / NRRL 28638) TaxID=796925 RepID=A0A137P461_CONC2|nr:hypothetical protein CONCODRAFT_7748 [Conidiobolus coronatus NRRL 28638]|eukprot:KXN69802.1 hypothetical protein CONCODRAFT_7748 [Conidiobolus coronatus NRRL 28638]